MKIKKQNTLVAYGLIFSLILVVFFSVSENMGSMESMFGGLLIWVFGIWAIIILLRQGE